MAEKEIDRAYNSSTSINDFYDYFVVKVTINPTTPSGLRFGTTIC